MIVTNKRLSNTLFLSKQYIFLILRVKIFFRQNVGTLLNSLHEKLRGFFFELIGLPDVNHDGYFVKKPVFASTYNVIIVSNVCILINRRYSKFNRWMPLEMSYKF